ncbi:MAG: sigma-54-dependent Fis family transcriptional regulator [Desulfarculus sp.]|nr:MAG: sigma-54-dependent Fis family transcriptional regulator [Desulfarculus sp.]
MPDNKPRIMIVDDDELVREMLAHIVQKEGFVSLLAPDGESALKKVSSEKPDLLLVDFKMPGMNGMEVMTKAKALDPDLPVVMITAYADIEGAVEAIRVGFYDYLAKPFDNRDVIRVIHRALSEVRLKRKLRSLTGRIQAKDFLRELMGPSDAVTRLITNVNSVADTDFSVLILGETGSGKELVSQALHRCSLRSEAPFIAIDCGAIPESLFESEVFGHEKGAYTGADHQKPGKIEMAHGGTFFLDEIYNMPMGSQSKLLRALQEKKIYRVGDTKPREIDVRLLAASNMDLEAQAVKGDFRNDLFYRLNEFTIRVPPLRERKEDILYLAKRFLDQASKELDKSVKGLSENAVRALVSHAWPGNVRQLKATIRRAVLLAEEVVRGQHLDLKNSFGGAAELPTSATDVPWQGESLREIAQRCTVIVERRVIQQVLQRTGGNKAKAARLLQVDYKTLHTKLKTLGLKAPDGEKGWEG